MAMRVVFLSAVVVGLLSGVLVAGARCALSDGDGGVGGAGPAVTTASGSPGATAAAFATAWSEGDTNALYLLLSQEAQRANPPDLFAAAYTRFATELTLVSLAATVESAEAGRARLAVRASTAYFGDLEYTTTLNLSSAPGGWVVDWQPSALHPDMVDDREFKSTIQRPIRGTIFDRNGVELAVTRDIRMLGLNRSLVQDRAALTRALLDFGFTQEQVDGAFDAPGGATQRVRVGQVTDDKVEEASAKLRPLAGVVLYFESLRVHPLGPSAAHVVGYTREYTAEELAARRGLGFRVGDRRGATGLEASQEAVLAGTIGAELNLLAPDGAVVRTFVSHEFAPGRDIHTTLDAGTLQAAHQRLGTRAGAVVVIDPATNDILAINSSPSFDPDAFERNDSAALAAITQSAGAPLANRAITGLYSAGSTFKLVTGAAGLAYGGYTPADRLECGSIWNGVDPPRRNWEGAQGLLTIAEALMRSCNTVFYEIALTLYNETDGALSQMARAFGFGAETGTAGIADEDGQVPDAEWKRANTGLAWFPGDEVNLGIGQGDLLITPLQLANAYSSFMSGELRNPRVLADATVESRGAIPLTPEQFDHLKLGLRLVTTARGTASAAFALAGYTDFAGKSGTAEDAGSQQHVLFVAMSPAAAPRALAAVVLDEGQSGSIEAGPIARDVVLAALN
ncbi:MAG: penicillin-binding transpeptidase domain-containing protein [Dehalococcoidia bacterium]|nr:penicillin-binding transpeptidase domain-containing protein [Dehalococcoidia bacterium]